MTDKNIRDFERLIATNVVPESARVLKSMIRFSRDIKALQKICVTVAYAAPDSHKVNAANLIEFADGLALLIAKLAQRNRGLRAFHQCWPHLMLI
jgi:hypothetical protein